MQLLTAKEVADRCRMPVEWVEAAIPSGKIPVPICLDGHHRWRESDIDEWMEAGCCPPAVSDEPKVDPVIPNGNLNLRAVEKKIIEEALSVCHGNREKAARLLGIGERTLYRKVREYDLK